MTNTAVKFDRIGRTPIYTDRGTFNANLEVEVAEAIELLPGGSVAGRIREAVLRYLDAGDYSTRPLSDGHRRMRGGRGKIITVYMEKDDIARLRVLDGNVSDHVRVAVERYLIEEAARVRQRARALEMRRAGLH